MKQLTYYLLTTYGEVTNYTFRPVYIGSGLISRTLSPQQDLKRNPVFRGINPGGT